MAASTAPAFDAFMPLLVGFPTTSNAIDHTQTRATTLQMSKSNQAPAPPAPQTKAEVLMYGNYEATVAEMRAGYSVSNLAEVFTGNELLAAAQRPSSKDA